MNSTDNKTLHELIELSKQGNLNAIEKILEDYNNLIYSWVHAVVDEQNYRYRYSDELQDLIQIAKTAFFQSMYGYKENESAFLSYAHVCVSNAIRNEFRRSRSYKGSVNQNALCLDKRISEDEDMYFLDLVPNNQPEFEGSYCVDEQNPKVMKEKIRNDFNEEYANIYDLLSQGYKHYEIGQKLAIHEKKVGYCLKNMRKFYNGQLTKKK